MRISNFQFLAISAILVLSAILRLYKLDSYPVSIYWDEAAIGYNAFSIAQTGKDEYGTKLPLLFKSFNDYKLPGYIYTDTIFVRILGLSIFSTRLPSALFGSLSVLAIYLIAKKLFDEKIALASSFVLAISPWAIQFSRAAFEASLAFTIILFGSGLLLYGQRRKTWAALSIPTLSLSLYFYLSARLFVPLILLVFFVIYRQEIRQNLRSYLLGLILSIVITAPLLLNAFSTSALKHVTEVSIFSDKSLVVDYTLAKGENPNIMGRLFLNSRIPYVFESFHNYFAHFSPGFLFFGDDPNPRHHSAFHGNLYLFEIVLLALGTWQIIKSKSSAKYFLLLWLLISPLPAAFSKEAPHSLRSLQMLLPLTITSSFGLIYMFKNPKLKALIVVVIGAFFINYLYSYYKVYPQRDSLSWGYGYQQMYKALSSQDQNYDRVVVTGYWWKPYIYYLYFNKIDPKVFQQNPNIESIGKYRFGSTFWDSGGKNLNDSQIDILKGARTLLVLSPEEFQDLKDKSRFQLLKSISDYSGRNEVFKIGEWH